MNTTYKSNNNVVYSCKYHVVWCPKYRRKVLINGVDVRLKELLTEYAANLSVDILEMEIMPDHVHMLLEVDPQFGIHKAVKSFKGYTSRILRQEFPYLKTKMPTLWTNSYFVSTVGGAPLGSTRTENRKTSSIRPWDVAGSSTTGDLPCVRKAMKMGKRSAIPRLPPC
ncbi:IS200/IS605 family transposase [Blautia massiliensis (ex Durand et al. 2017)]|nr:IS200/IS605 family transposase [Blautia massiliensis (ex Durand et al. 2017)]